ncbi:MAG: TolC family protein [Balneolaceae bacterium]|nr:TolC family protein [Balneolaceae bacterium]
MKRLILTLAFVGLSAANGSAQELLTPDKAVTLALSRNHDIAIVELDGKAASNRATPGNAGLLSSIQISSGATYSNMDVTFASFGENGVRSQAVSEDGVTGTSYQGSIGVNYVLFDGFSGRYRLEALKLRERLTETRFRAIIEQTLASVMLLYLDVARLQQQLQISREAISLSIERLNRIEEGY